MKKLDMKKSIHLSCDVGEGSCTFFGQQKWQINKYCIKPEAHCCKAKSQNSTLLILDMSCGQTHWKKQLCYERSAVKRNEAAKKHHGLTLSKWHQPELKKQQPKAVQYKNCGGNCFIESPRIKQNWMDNLIIKSKNSNPK